MKSLEFNQRLWDSLYNFLWMDFLPCLVFNNSSYNWILSSSLAFSLVTAMFYLDYLSSVQSMPQLIDTGYKELITSWETKHFLPAPNIWKHLLYTFFSSNYLEVELSRPFLNYFLLMLHTNYSNHLPFFFLFSPLPCPASVHPLIYSSERMRPPPMQSQQSLAHQIEVEPSTSP